MKAGDLVVLRPHHGDPRLQQGDYGLVLSVSDFGGFRHVLWSRINRVRSVHANHMSVETQEVA